MPGGDGSTRQSARRSARTHRGHWENGRYVYTDGLDGIPGHHKAHLMYYLHSVCYLLEIDHDPKINRLRRYRKYHDLTPKQTDRLIALCMWLSPDRLQDKYLYLSDTSCRERSNRFYETEVADRTVNCDEAYFDVDGETKRCEKVMSIKMDWIDEYWTEPMLALVKDRQRQIKMERSRPSVCDVM